MLRQQQVMMQQASEACAASREDEASGSTNCDVSPREFEGMSREQLIARLMVLEQEKRAGGGVTTTNRGEQSQVATSEAAVEIKSETSTNVDDDEGPSTPPDTHRSAADNNAERSSESNSKHEDGGEEDEEEEDEDGDSEQPDQVQSKPMQCLWKDCGQMLENMQKLISHISDNHVGSGKVCTCSCLLIHVLIYILYSQLIDANGKDVQGIKSLLPSDTRCIIICVPIQAKDHLFAVNQASINVLLRKACD